MAKEQGRREFLLESLGASGLAAIKKISEKQIQIPKAKENLKNRREVLADNLAAEYELDRAEVLNILNSLQPGKSEEIVNKKGKNLVIAKSASPEPDGKYRITVYEKVSNTKLV